MRRVLGARHQQAVLPAVGAPLLATVLVTACATPGTGTFSGTITGPDGRAQSGCSLSVVAGSDVDRPVPEYAAVSDGAGGYEYRLPPGTYEVTATCGSGTGSATAHLDAGAVTELDFTVG